MSSFINKTLIIGLSLFIIEGFCETPNNKSNVLFSQNADSPLFANFTGKIKGSKASLRVAPDSESNIAQELKINDLFLVVGEKENFYAVLPPPEFKAYVFRSFILDGTVECNRVNVRTAPSLDAPIIAHLNTGDQIDGTISESNPKWYAITPPKETYLYIAKNQVDRVGGPDVKTQTEQKNSSGQQELFSTNNFTQTELKKPFQEINFNQIQQKYQAIITNYEEFSEIVNEAKKSQSAFEKEYLERKIDHHTETTPSNLTIAPLSIVPTEKIEFWNPIEKALYLTWAATNEEPTLDEFYDEQRQVAESITGVIEPYSTLVKNRPGDFLLKDKGIPMAYLYSTQVNLEELVGKKVTVIASPRDNNNFAFPAFFVLSVE